VRPQGAVSRRLRVLGLRPGAFFAAGVGSGTGAAIVPLGGVLGSGGAEPASRRKFSLGAGPSDYREEGFRVSK
jgi:hypothetical protein